MFGESAGGPACRDAHWLPSHAPAAAVLQYDHFARHTLRGAVGPAQAEEGKRSLAGRHVTLLNRERLRGGADAEERRLAVCV